MSKKYFLYLLILINAILVTGCDNSDNKPPIAVPVSQKPVLMDPFRYHKMIEVSPGQDFDVLSWGRGATALGAFAILHSDSAAAKYTTTTGDLDGAITDVYNSDMDLDGNPEILIQAKGKDTINYTNIYAFEFTNGKAEKLIFPKLTRSQKAGYRGNDNFYIKDGILIREFPIYNGNGNTAKATGQKRELQYGLRNNSFTVKQLSKDSTSVNAVKPVKPVVNVPVKTSSHVSTKHVKKHTIVKKPKKKKRRRRYSDEG